MSCNGVKKENPRINSSNVYSYIANNSETKLTLNQVRECFQLYHKMIVELTTSNHFKDDTTIILPHIGHFHLVHKHGRKSGSTYTLFNDVVTLDKSEPSFCLLKFKVYKALHELIKSKTKYYE